MVGVEAGSEIDYAITPEVTLDPQAELDRLETVAQELQTSFDIAFAALQQQISDLRSRFFPEVSQQPSSSLLRTASTPSVLIPRSRQMPSWKANPFSPRDSVIDTTGIQVTGQMLRTRRLALGISQASVARAANCSRGLVAEVERQKRRSQETLKHLNTTFDRLEEQGMRGPRPNQRLRSRESA